MIDHMGITVKDFDAAKRFYDAALAPLGATLMMMVPAEHTGGVKVGGYGRDRPQFWMREGQKSGEPQHIAIVRLANDDRATTPCFDEPNAPEDQRTHDAFTELRLGNQQSPQPVRRDD